MVMKTFGVKHVLLAALFGSFASGSVDFKTRNFNTIQAIYDFTAWGNSTPFLEHGIKAVPPNLFAENATGRVSPVGNFSGLVETSEYFWGLGPQAEDPFYIAWTRFDLVNFQSECPEVASSKVHIRTSVVNPGARNNGEYVTTLVQTAFWRFNEEGAVIAYDAALPNVGLWFSKAYNADFTDRAVQIKTIDNLCKATQERCTGAYKQFDSIEQCIVFHASAPFGSYDEIWGNNTVCRTIHVILTRLRPDLHCPHVGPTGGMKCVDIDYNQYYFDDKALFGRENSFVCQGQK